MNKSSRTVISLLGAPRCGKDTVASFLVERKGFLKIAFADQIKLEFGISISEFEKLKGTEEEGLIRKRLWAFSDSKLAKDPLYFINIVKNKIQSNVYNSFVIPDVRTEDEFSLFDKQNIYWIRNPNVNEHVGDYLSGSRIKIQMLNDVKNITNDFENKERFLLHLEDHFRYL